MESKDKYFTPSIEDIRVGYECDIWWNYNYLPENEWCTVRALEGSTEEFDIYDFTSRIPKNEIRVPYLTKEQIEADGWGKGYGLADFEKTKPILWSARRIDNITYDLQYDFDTLELILVKGINVVYRGECKDINTFRLICKLLGV